VQNLAHEASGIESSMHNISSEIVKLQQPVRQMKYQLTSRIRPTVDAAIQQTIKLGESAVSLSTASGSTRRQVIADCKGMSKKINSSFRAVYDIASRDLKGLDNIKTSTVYLRSQADTKEYRVRDMLQIAESSIASTRTLQNLKRDAVRVAERDISSAHETRRNAERDLAAKRRDRELRDIFSLGLGALGDWGGLNSAIAHAESIIRSADANLRSAHQAMELAQAAMRSIEHELQSLSNLKSRLGGLMGPLDALKWDLSNLLREVTELAKTALDITVFAGALVATSAPLEDIRTAADFARSIQKLQGIVNTNIKLVGAFISQVNIMNDALREIIASDEAPNDLI